MTEKFLYIEPHIARRLIAEAESAKPVKRGIDSRVYLLGDYAVLKTSRLKLRNVTTRDDELIYLDDLIHTLMELKNCGVNVVPILGYCYNPESADGDGYMLQPTAKGEELYDDAVLMEFAVCAQNTKYLSSDKNAKEYILDRTKTISAIPQEHFDKYISDIIELLEHDILIDFLGKSNFFYDEHIGFQFIDINSHTNYHYGLTDIKPDSKRIASIYGYTPCHFAVGTRVFAPSALDENALCALNSDELRTLKMYNCTIFDKCRSAMLNNRITEADINIALESLKVFGR